MTKKYNVKNIRYLLMEGFSEKELRQLCFEVANFKALYYQLADNDGLAEIVELLLEYCERKLEYETLLAWVKEQNPARYETHRPYFLDELESEIQAARSVRADIFSKKFLHSRYLLWSGLLGLLLSLAAGWWFLGGPGRSVKLAEIDKNVCQPWSRPLRIGVAQLASCPVNFQKHLIDSLNRATTLQQTFKTTATARAQTDFDLIMWGECNPSTDKRVKLNFELMTTSKPDEVYEPTQLSVTSSLTEVINTGTALISYQQGQYDLAAFQFDALAATRTIPEQALLWANSLLLAGKYEEAIEGFNEIKGLYPEWGAIYNNLGVTRFNNSLQPGKEGFVIAGLSEFEQAMILAKKQNQNELALLAYINKSDLYRRLGNWDDARQDCDGARQLDARSALTHVCYSLYGFSQGTGSDQGVPFNSIKQHLEQAEQAKAPVPAKLYYLQAAWYREQNQPVEALAAYESFFEVMKYRACLETDLLYLQEAEYFSHQLAR